MKPGDASNVRSRHFRSDGSTPGHTDFSCCIPATTKLCNTASSLLCSHTVNSLLLSAQHCLCFILSTTTCQLSCSRMASQDHLQEVQQEIKGVLEKISEMETSLAAAEEAGVVYKVRFLCDRLVQLDRGWVALQEKVNKLMIAQPGVGQPCFHWFHCLVLVVISHR